MTIQFLERRAIGQQQGYWLELLEMRCDHRDQYRQRNSQQRARYAPQDGPEQQRDQHDQRRSRQPVPHDARIDEVAHHLLDHQQPARDDCRGRDVARNQRIQDWKRAGHDRTDRRDEVEQHRKYAPKEEVIDPEHRQPGHVEHRGDASQQETRGEIGAEFRADRSRNLPPAVFASLSRQFHGLAVPVFGFGQHQQHQEQDEDNAACRAGGDAQRGQRA